MEGDILTIKWYSGEMHLVMQNFCFFPCTVAKLKKLEKIIYEDNNSREIFRDIAEFVHDQIHVCVKEAESKKEDYKKWDNYYEAEKLKLKRKNFNSEYDYLQARLYATGTKDVAKFFKAEFKKYEKAVKLYGELYAYILEKWEWALKRLILSMQ